MSSPASIITRAGVATLSVVAAVFYVGVCVIMGKGIAWTPLVIVALVTWWIAPTVAQLEGLAADLEAHIKHIASDD